MGMETVLYLVQVVSLLIALVCTIIMYTRMMKAYNYMKNYCNNTEVTRIQSQENLRK